MTVEDIRNALRVCYAVSHPYTGPINIVDLGLVETISLEIDADAPGASVSGISPRYKLDLALVPAVGGAEHEDANAMLHAQIANRLAGMTELSRTHVHWLQEPVWTTERMAPELYRSLQPIFPILNNG